MDERDRLVQTQQFFRGVNERIRELAEGFASVPGRPVEFICECGAYTCLERLSLGIDDYRRLRGGPGRYLVMRGHQEPEHRVVAEAGDVLAVELE